MAKRESDNGPGGDDLRRRTRAQVRHPYITGQGLRPRRQQDEPDEKRSSPGADPEGETTDP